ncbi:hypothetical protein IWZ00DRAFT_556836 [Phyllosticta capitalensis]
MENETFHPVSNRTVFIPPEDAPKEDDKDMWVQHGLPSLMGIVSQQEYQPVFDDAKYSDMTITLSDGQQYKLQKAILCATSYALGFEIEQLEKIRQEKIRQEKIRHRRVDTTALNMNIFTHHPAVVKQAIYYIYHRSYTEPSCTCEYLSKRSPDKGADARPRILHNTMVYDFARAYCIQELEQKALEKIAPDLVYSNSSKFSDLTLVDDSGNQHLVHRHVLCAASPFFEKTIQSLLQDSGDPARQTIKIHDTHPAIVYCGLDFIYNMTYDEPYKRSPIPSRKEYEQRILFNTNVYAFARKHEIGALEKFAVNKIEMDLRHEVETNPCGMPRLVLEILETVPDEEEPQAGYKGDFPLHKLLVKACVPKYDRFYWNFPEAYEARTRYPRLIEDILNY